MRVGKRGWVAKCELVGCPINRRDMAVQRVRCTAVCVLGTSNGFVYIYAWLNICHVKICTCSSCSSCPCRFATRERARKGLVQGVGGRDVLSVNGVGGQGRRGAVVENFDQSGFGVAPTKALS